MRLHSWTGAWCLLPVLVLLTVPHVKAAQQQPKERHYYIAAVEIDWDYSGNDPHRLGPTYKKVVFREYDKDFRQAKTHPSWLGLLGPTLRAVEGETIVVTFRNMATGPHSIHPHGVAYGKQSEGANYFDNTSQKEKEDDVVQPNGQHVYHWEVTSDVSPQPDDPTCLTYTYVSHINVVEDYNAGLIGTLLVCKPGSLDELGQQVGVHHEYVFLFGVFDEAESTYRPRREADHVKYTINGYAMGSLPDVSVCAYASVSLHLLGMSSEPEIFSVHMNGQVLQQNQHKVSSVGLISGSTATASMVALHTGRWLLSSHTIGHVEAGMYGFVDVKRCDGFRAPQRRMTVEQKRHSRVWTYYIAAEEIIWDYAPEMPGHIDGDFKFQYLRQSSMRIGGKYKKAVYTLYTNASFTETLEPKQKKRELGILGPVIRAQIRDVIKIVFKNLASRPYSIYPHGLTLEKPEEGVNYPAGGNHSHGVQPGETHTYIWKVVDEDEPFEGDPRCLTRLYHSAVNTPRDIASGLIGQILICKSQSLNIRGVQLKADKEQHAMFAVFDENKSWYLEDNIQQFSDRSKVNKADPDFYKSNVMHTINGYVYESGPLLGFCNGEIVTWHVSSIGAQDYVQTVTFYGHTFELNGRTEDFLSLYPMTGETITMNMDNIGVWLMASLNSHETTKGVRVKFQDVECYRDHQYEYSDYDDPSSLKEFTEWNPLSLAEVMKEEEKATPEKKIPTEIDMYTDMFADELGLRSRRNQSRGSEVEHLDLSFLDYDYDADDTNITLNLNKTMKKSQAYIPKPNALNETLFSNGTEVDGRNLTAVNLLNQSISENTTHVQNNSTPSTFGNSTVNKTENTTVFYSPNKLPNNDSITVNSSVSVISNPDDATVSDTKNIAAHDATVSSMVENVSTENTDRTVTLQGTGNRTETSRGNSSSIMEAEGMNVTLTGENQTSVIGTTLAEASEERLTRGDVFFYPPSNTNTNNLHSPPEGDAASLSHSAKEMDENSTASRRVIESANEINRSSSIPPADVGRVNISSIDRSSLTISEVEVESTGNETRDNDSLVAAAEPEYLSSLEVQMNSSDIVASSDYSSLENVTRALLESGSSANVTANVSRSNSSESRENITALLGELNRTSSAESSSNETNPSLSSDAGGKSDSYIVAFPDNSSLENVTHALLESEPSGNSTANVSRSNSSAEIRTESRENITALLGELNRTSSAESYSNETNLSLSGDAGGKSDSYIVAFPDNSSLENVTHTLLESEPSGNITANVSRSNSSAEIRTGSRENITALLGELNRTSSAESSSYETNLSLSSDAGGKSNSYIVAFPDNSSLENVTHTLLESEPSGNITANVSRSNSSAEIRTGSRENITALLGELNRTSSAESSSNETNLSLSSDTGGKSDSYIVAFPDNSSLENVTHALLESEPSGNVTGNETNPSLSGDAGGKSDSVELSASDGREEVLIYLSENKTQVIKTTVIKTQGHNWTYDGTHQMEIEDISNDMMKYLERETPQTTPTPKKKTRKVNRRQWPDKGHGMKTKRRKEYKPLSRSGSPLSPRGFNPGMTPRGSRPLSPRSVSDEAELNNRPVVIGVPRSEFSDYELYIPGDEPSYLENIKADEYEYVTYKDPYSSHDDLKYINLDDATKYYLKLSGPNVKTYFITAEEVEWDYSGYGQRRPDKWQQHSRETKFTKAVFRGYMDSSFSTPDIRGELDEHLGILGPVIKAEVGQSIMVVFRNLAKRPYSLHPKGVSYAKQTEGLSYEDGSQYWFKYDNEVQPNTTFTYLWKVPSMVGPLPDESHCRTWAYYSGVNPERDIHSGLIGPLLVCREGTLDRKEPIMREFTMLFMTFDESKSWYYQKNHELMQRKSRRRVMDHNLKENLKFHSVNGIIFSLKGLRMYTKQLVCWYLINMGSPKDFQSIHFHGQTFIHKKITSYRQAVYPLLPGSFATLEMYPSKPGLWQLETEVGFNQQQGMQTLFLVLDNDCFRPLGLESGSVKDNQITAINTRGYWKPHLARLNNNGGLPEAGCAQPGGHAGSQGAITFPVCGQVLYLLQHRPPEVDLL
ncbi:coagulation factor V isoform X2 [Pseudoliparis swirei]|uniref:coagulation factor V isoform X2 n=1 Tax=Pseudoliparis swirei TaxID=2059687 RepID=UPI0024BE4E7E|nr:coagulation factor V isoform X2 [Pseudoliparis swirei]